MEQGEPWSQHAKEQIRQQPFLPKAAMPKGGGSIRGIGEKVSVSPARGTCSVQMPVFTSPGRSSFGPALSLSYDSGAGNSAFGFGWNVAVPAIARKTDKGVPRYADADTFVLVGGEDLMPSDELVPDETIDGVVYHIRRYRPRVITAFVRIERCDSDAGDTFWRTVSPDNVRSVFGRTARIVDPADPSRVFQWLLEEVRDDRGNVAVYEYTTETAPAANAVWERNRLGVAQVQRHLYRIRYCDHFLVEFEYEPRPDPFSTYRAGFEVRTWRRCRRIAMYHDFPDEFSDGPNPRLIRSTDLSYDDDPAGCHLIEVKQTGYVWTGDGYTSESLPPVQFEYTKSGPEDVVRVVDAPHLPSGVDGERYHWVDLDGEGLPGALTQQGGAWFYKRNLGSGRLGALESIPLQPSIAGDGGSIALLDLGGDGGRSLVRRGPALHGYQERTTDGWGPFQPFVSNVVVDWADPALNQADLDGDGLADLLFTHGHELLFHLSLGREGFGPQGSTPLGSDEERGPVLISWDASELIMLADMSGDGLPDLVRVRNGSVCYWPNLGHGRFGAKVTMGDAPLFDFPELFEPARLRTADIDGSGTTDLLYLGRDRVRYWINQSGNKFGAAVELPVFPDTDDLTTVDVIDLLGSGTACLVWSSPHMTDRESPLRYVDLSRAISDWLPESHAAGHKPHLLCQITNNLGGQTRVVYAPSTRFYLADLAAGQPWVTRLHFPVQLVAQMESFDHIAKTRLSTSYRYRHGYFDAVEREYRGFGMVERTDAEVFPLFSEAAATELHRPPVRTRTWFHLGAPIDFRADFNVIDPLLDDHVLPEGLSAHQQREALRALTGAVLRVETYADDGAPNAGVPYVVTQYRYRVEVVGEGVFRYHPLESLVHHYERDPTDPRVSHDIVVDVDAYNTVRHAVSIAYPRRTPHLSAQQQLRMVRTITEVTHVTAGTSYRIGVPIETRTYEVTGLTPSGDRFTLDEVAQAGTARLIEHLRARYWNDSLTGALPAGQVGTRALTYETYKIAFLAADIATLFGGRVTDALLAEAGYVFADGAWWIPSGIRHHDPTAFYLPAKLVSPFGNEASVEYDTYKLLPVVSRASTTAPYDALVTQVVNDYRLLGAVSITDPNGNSASATFDALGRITATWTHGKNGEGDPQALPGTEFIYHTASLPTWSEARVRERHGDPNSPIQRARAYSDGTGRIILTKHQAEPGTDGQPRWIGSGRTVFDNKGLPVKQYEPYFSPTESYENDVPAGVTAILHYDPAGRLMRTDYPDGTFTRVVINPWHTETWDANDTVLDSLWYAERGAPDPATEPEPADPDRRAAWLAAKHARTPSVSHLDTLGRVVCVIADGGPLGTFETVYQLDIEGNQLSVTDPRGIVVQNTQYDLAGRPVVTHSPDAGERWVLFDINGVPIRVWDSRGYIHEYHFDLLRRATRTWVTTPTAQRILTQAIWYGEEHPAAVARNLLGRGVITLDGSGFAHSVEYDFKGNLLIARHRLAWQYQQTPDWSALDGAWVSDVESQAAALGLLDNELYQTSTQFDALNRPIHDVLPDGSVIVPTYNEGGVLDNLKVNDEYYVRELDYDAKGQRQFIVYGNFVRTRYTYDPLTFRLIRLETFRSGAPNERLQDLRYTYDAVGNLTEIRDEAQQTHFYAGQIVSPGARYEYDALYRLSAASGREHDSLQGDHRDPALGKPIPHPNDAAKVRRYTETYEYDASNNLIRVRHMAGPTGSWTREYTYATSSNRLLSHTGPATFTYDEHGNMTTMPHLPGPLSWDHLDRLSRVEMLGGGTAYYAYDSRGERSRKVLHRNGGLVEERIYLGDFEIHRRVLNGVETFRRTTVHVMDDKQRIALIEHNITDGDVRVRYQLGNHLGSCSLEVDNSPAALIVSYEEYHPYGTTSLWLAANNVEASDRRYRYTGKEKDEETALYYMGARYYSPWLGRWTAPDPAGLVDGTCVYAYCRNNPIILHDPSGTQGQPPPPGLITNDPKLGKLWEQAVVEELGPRYGAKTYAEVVEKFQKEVAQKIAEKGIGSNKQKGTGIGFARETYAKVRTRFGKLAEKADVSLRNIQVHHTFAELAKVPSEALTTTNLSFQKGNAGTEGSGHNFAHEVNKAHEAGVPNPGQHVKVQMEAKGIKPDVPELGPSVPHTPQAHTPKVPHEPHVPKTPHLKTPHAKTPKTGGKGGIIGVVLTIGIATYVFLDTGDAYAAAQTANPAAETTEAILSGEGSVAEAVGKDLYYFTPVGTLDYLITEGLGPTGYVARKLNEKYGEPYYSQELADKAIREGRNPFCAQCHGPGGALDPNNEWIRRKEQEKLDEYLKLLSPTDEQQMIEYLKSISK